MKRILALAVAAFFLAQNTGAADLAVAFAAARPMPLAFPHPMGAPRRAEAAPKKAQGPSLADRIGAALASYSDDLYTVALWALDALDRSQAPAAAPAPLARPVTPAPAPEPSAAESVGLAAGAVVAAAAAAFERPVDRILIAPDAEIIGAASALGSRLSLTGSEAGPTHPRVEGFWLNGPGFKYRVNYLNAYGTTKGVEGGYVVDCDYTRERFVPSSTRVPDKLRRVAPIYFRGMHVSFEVEVVAEKPLRGAHVFARQEELDGTKLTDIDVIGELNLAAGERALLKSSTSLRGNGQERVNFEQTHLVVSGADGSVLVDEHAAGIVDPPGQ